MAVSTPTSILSRGISAYSIPPDLLSNLSVRSIQAQSTAEDDDDEANAATSSTPAKKNTAAVTTAAAGSLSCQTCPNVGFDTVEEQRAHFKSDWHRYNAKAKLKGKAVGQAEWEEMVERVSSISGSASSSSSGSSQSKITRLLNKHKVASSSSSSGEEAELVDRQRRAHLRSAVIWFSPTTSIDDLGIPKDTQFGIHRALFPPFENAADYLKELAAMQLANQAVTAHGDDEEGERRLTMLMVAGGHFAGMVVGIRPRAKTERQDVKGAGEVRVLKHKTFHRYTTRKKQGGSQALNDNAKSKAVSAGAMLRRYGEQALQEEIRALLIDWAEDIHASERIFIRASTHGKKSFWGYEGAPIEKGDERIRVFPFPTRRPTLQELLRCWHELTRVKVSHLSQEALQAQDDAYIASLQPKRAPIKPASAPTPQPAAPAVPRLSPEEEARLDRRKRLEDMIRKGRVDALRPFWAKYKAEFDSSTLGLAAASGQEEVIHYFLEEERLDPTTTVDGGRRAYDLATTKEARNVFRRFAHAHPDLWDWKEAHVPSGLSEEMEAEQDRKKAEKRKGLREKLKEREKARAAEEAAAEPAPAQTQAAPPSVPPTNATGGKGPQKLGGRLGGESTGLGGLSGEMRAQIERERRARAAEARLR